MVTTERINVSIYMVTRNAKNTQSKILAAATQAFVALGPAGARVDAIAAAAGVNKRMLYHHFGDKQGLYQAVLAASKGADGQLSADRARLLAWEGLSQASEQSVRAPSDLGVAQSEPESARLMNQSIAPVKEPGVRGDLDAQMLALLQTALQVFPHVCGPEVERLTGLTPGSEAFDAALDRLRDQVERQMNPKGAVQTPKAKVTLRARSMPRS